MRKKTARLLVSTICVTALFVLCTSCATTITPEVEEEYNWTHAKKVCVIGVADLEGSRVIAKALSHHLFEDGVPVVTRETQSVTDIYDVARKADAGVLAYGVVKKIETTRSATIYPPTTVKQVDLELNFLETDTQKVIWKGSGSKADSANIKNEFVISSLVGEMAHEAVPVWGDLPRGAVGIPMLAVGDKAPQFEVSDIDGNLYSLEDQIGEHVVVISFWSFFCEPCKRTLRTLNEVHRRYHLHGVDVVAVSLEGEPMLTRIRSRVYQERLEFTFLLDEPKGDSYEIADPYMVPGTPALYIIDKSGTIVFAKAGYITAGEIGAVLEAQIAK